MDHVDLEEQSPRAMSLKKMTAILVSLAFGVFVVLSAYQGFRKLGDSERSGRILGELSRLRGYVADFKARRGFYPPDLSGAAPEVIDLREHSSSAEVMPVLISSAAVAGGVLTAPPMDAGKWGYDSAIGFVFISCTHDNHSRGRPWFSF